MSLRSSTFALPKGADAKAKAETRKSGLLTRHREAMEKVVLEAKSFSAERKRDLGKIADDELRQSAAR